jgi:RNA polymerase sigma factor (sigma-70 family)
MSKKEMCGAEGAEHKEGMQPRAIDVLHRAQPIRGLESQVRAGFSRVSVGKDDTPLAPVDLMSLYLAHRAALIRFAAARTGSAEEAEDIVQEMYFRLERGEHSAVQSGLPYLYKMVLNLVVDRVRSRRRTVQRDGAYLQASATMLEAEAIAEAPHPDDVIDSRRRLSQLVAAVRELPPQCGKVFRLHKLEGRTHAEVAAKLGISKSAVEKHMISALKHLSRLLQ